MQDKNPKAFYLQRSIQIKSGIQSLKERTPLENKVKNSLIHSPLHELLHACVTSQ
jgi:hypothetical protein